jgi:adenylate kinase
LRQAVADKTALGGEAAAYISRGALVPDDLIVNLVAERLKEKDCARGFLLDGFPRTIPQAEGLDEILDKMGLRLNGVLSVQVPENILIERLAGRRTCRQCGALTHVAFNTPKTAGVCDRCGGELYQREDDKEETVAHRLEVYRAQTAPLVDYYQKRSLVRVIDGVGEIGVIRARIIEALGELVR